MARAGTGQEVRRLSGQRKHGVPRALERERGRGGNVVEAIGKRARPTSRCRSLLSPFLCPVVRTFRPRRASPPCRRRSAFEQAHLQAQRHHGMWHEPEAPRGGRRRRHPCSAATQRRVHEPAPATRGARVELVVVVVLRRRRSRTCRSPSTMGLRRNQAQTRGGGRCPQQHRPTRSATRRTARKNQAATEPAFYRDDEAREANNRAVPSAAMQIGSQKPQKKGAIMTA